VSGEHPSDADPFDRLFRPGDAEVEADAAPGPRIIRPDATAPTGRLFRSSGAEADDALPALPEQRPSQPRATMPTPEVEVAAMVIEEEEAAPEPPEPRRTARRESRRMARGEIMDASPRRRSARGLTPLGVCIAVFGTTLLVGAAEALVRMAPPYGPGLGWATGIALVAVTAYAAAAVRRTNLMLPVVLPPLAFALAELTVGQIGLVPPGSPFIKRAVDTFFALGQAWVWMVGAVALGLVICLVRALGKAR
jgi:hypothetical protein